MEIQGFFVVESSERLTALLECLDDSGVTVLGKAEDPEDIQMNDMLEIGGSRDWVLERLDACDPAWSDYLRRL